MKRSVPAKGAHILRTITFNEVTDYAPIADFSDVGRVISLAQAPDDMLISVGLDEHHVGLRTVARIDSLDKSSLKTSHTKDYLRRSLRASF